MPKKPTKLSDAQFFLLAWLDEKDRHGRALGMEGVGVCSTNKVPSCITMPDKRVIYEPIGVRLAAMVGLVRRHLVRARGNGFYVITDYGRAVLAERADLIDALGHPPDEFGMPVRVR